MINLSQYRPIIFYRTYANSMAPDVTPQNVSSSMAPDVSGLFCLQIEFSSKNEKKITSDAP